MANMTFGTRVHMRNIGLYVQYGCGWSGPREWVNFDASPTLRFERIPVIGRWYTRNAARFPEHVQYGDIVKGLPVTDGSVDGLYASHVLEHLSLEDFHTALRNSLKLLKPSGIFRLVMPDLSARAEQYLSDFKSGDPESGHKFMRSCSLGLSDRPRGSRMVTQLFSNSAHLWMWDELSAVAALQNAGFSAIRRCEMGDSEDRMFDLVEDKSRFYNDGVRELAIEARK